MQTHSMLNTSSVSVKPQMMGSMSPVYGGIAGDVSQMVRPGVRVTGLDDVDIKQVEEALLREREERKVLKAQLKQEKKQVEVLSGKLKDQEDRRSELDRTQAECRRLERERQAHSSEVQILQNEIFELRKEKVLSEQLDEEHSAKMKVYTQDLMATSLKYQEDIQTLIGKNEKLAREAEVLRAKYKELERQTDHSTSVMEVLNRKVLAKDSEITSLRQQLDKLHRLEKSSKSMPSSGGDSLGRIEELETLVQDQMSVMAEQEAQLSELRSKLLSEAKPRLSQPADDAFGILRSSKNLIMSPGRRVSHLTLREQSYAPVHNDCSEWLEPLAVAEHVLSGVK